MEDNRLDRATVERAGGGDRSAVETVLRALAPQVWRIARRMLPDEDSAADASQEALLAIARGLARFDHRSAVETWAHRVATNACLDELRRRRRRPEPVDPQDLVADPAFPDDPQLRIDLDRALASLSDDSRAVVVLRDVMGHDYTTIAELLDIPVGTVRSRLARARYALVSMLSLDDPGTSALAPTSNEAAEPPPEQVQ